jgi:hypothetical protein
MWNSLAVVAVLAVVAAPASAQEGQGFFELFGGITFIGGDIELDCPPDLDIVCIPEGAGGNVPDLKGDFDDDTPTFGFGAGYRKSEKLALLGSVSWVDGEDTFGAPLEGSNLEIDVYYVDFSARIFPRGKGFFWLAGIGWATIDAKLDISEVPGIPERPGSDPERSDDAFTVHAGLGGEFDFSDRAYFLAQAKARWLDSEVYDDIDFETIIGFGFRFGG